MIFDKSIAKKTEFTEFLFITQKYEANARIIIEIISILIANHWLTPVSHVTANILSFSILLFSSINYYYLLNALIVDAPAQLSPMKLIRGLLVKLTILVISLNEDMAC